MEAFGYGSKSPVVGRVCMDLTMIDVGHIPDVTLEDEVVGCRPTGMTKVLTVLEVMTV